MGMPIPVTEMTYGAEAGDSYGASSGSLVAIPGIIGHRSPHRRYASAVGYDSTFGAVETPLGLLNVLLG
jgi:hypothetical protein